MAKITTGNKTEILSDLARIHMLIDCMGHAIDDKDREKAGRLLKSIDEKLSPVRMAIFEHVVFG